MLSNNSCFMSVCTNIIKHFDKLIQKRAFAHWYEGEGMESGEFQESREDLAFLAKDYEELFMDNV